MRVVRMRSNRAEDVGETLRDSPHLIELADARADRNHGPHASRAGARDHLVEFPGEVGEIQMAVAIDQHTWKPSLGDRDGKRDAEPRLSSVRGHVNRRRAGL